MKICIVAIDYDIPCGATTSLRRIAASVKDLGNEVHIVTNGNMRVLPQDYVLTSTSDNGVMVHRVSPFFHHIYSGDYPTRKRDYFSSKYSWGMDNLNYALAELHEKYGFHLYHGYGLKQAAFIAVLAGKQARRPSIISVRGSDITTNIYHPVEFPLIRWTLENCDAATFVAKELLEMANCVTSCRNKSTVIHNAVPCITEQSPRIIYPKKAIRIGFVGRGKRVKGLLHLFRAISLLDNPRIQLRLLGGLNKRERADYMNEIAALNLKEQVVLYDWLLPAEARSHYRSIDIYVSAAYHEGCSNSCLEAMSMGVPTVTTATGATLDFIRDGVNGLIAPPRDCKALAAAIWRLIASPKLYSQISRNGLKTAASLSSSREAAAYSRIYRHIAKQK